MKKPIQQKLAEEMMVKLGFDPKTGKPITSPHQVKDPHGPAAKSSYSTPTPPFRIRALEKTKRQSPRGKAYKYSALYRNAVVFRLLVKKFTLSLNPTKHHRLITQMDSAARSVVANIRERYLRPSSKEYSVFLGYSHGSLEEVRGDIVDAKDDGLMKSVPGSDLRSVGIELKRYKPPRSSYSSPNTSYDPLGEYKRIIRGFKSSKLTYELFIELINKTDYLLKRAVMGIDKKIISDEKEKLNSQLKAHWRKHW